MHNESIQYKPTDRKIERKMTQEKTSMVRLALVGLLLLGYLATTASAKNNVHVNSIDTNGEKSSESEGRVVYADMKMAKTSAPTPAPAPAPSTSSSDGGGEN